MSPSADSGADYNSPHSNLGYLHQQQQRSRARAVDQPQSRGRNISKYELGRRDRYGDRVTRIYPREIAKSPPNSKRYPSTSPTGPGAYNATTSPLLSALGATKTTAAQYTSEWTRSLPFFTNQSPPNNNAISISGSPNSRDVGYGQGAMAGSPPVTGMRPLSHPNQYTNFGGRLHNSPHQSPGRDRRASMYSRHGAQLPFAANPPLPHQPQAHYYNLPDLNLGLNPAAEEGITPGESGYYCGFGSLSSAGDEPSKPAENVVLTGYEGGLDVFRMERGKMDVIGRLEGLRGSVLTAKILPWASRRDPLAPSRPLIALVIHGPVIEETKDGQNLSSSSSAVGTDDNSSNSPSRAPSIKADVTGGSITHYQTSVEVYSLKERRQVAVLYKSPLIPIASPIDSPIFEPPPPAGEFVIDAKGKYVVVASGASGEVFVFAPYLHGHAKHSERFRCIGKVWTSVQLRERAAGTNSSASSAAEGNAQEDTPLEQYGVPVFSLSERWLAVSPPASTTSFPVNGVALVSATQERPPGLSHHTVPPQPTATCAVDAPEPDSFLNRLTREGTQVAIKGARWATERGMSAFKSYMGKPTNGQVNGVAQSIDPQFPPTHGHNQVQPRNEPTVISVYDLQKLADAEETRSKTALHAIATLPAALGCSFLSFSPSGLMLMTVSRKGDLQDVWDLKRINYRRARKTARETSAGPHARQIARFARMTVTNVVDVVWSSPRADRLAIITDKGTVHMFLMPASAFQWPPPRRIRKAAPQKKSEDDLKTSKGSGNAVNSAMKAITGASKPFFSRGSNGTSRFPSFSSLGMTPAAGAKSGKAVAAGVGKSISNIRHAGDNKLALPTSPSGVKPGSVRWLTGKGRGSIALVAGGVLQIYRVQMRPATGKGKAANATSISKKKTVEFGLAPVRNTVFAPAVAAQIFAQSGETPQRHEVHGEWLPRALPSRHTKVTAAHSHKLIAPAPLSYSEIETNPPYQPFYTDRRVTRFAFCRPPTPDQQGSSEFGVLSQLPDITSNLHHNNDDLPWLFGEDIEAMRISSPAQQVFDAEHDDEGMGAAATTLENKLVLRDGEEEVEQVVVTTRRRRTRRVDAGGEAEEEGFFEDDCDVLDFAEDRV